MSGLGGLGGNWERGLKELERGLDKIANKQVHASLNKQFAAESLSLVKQGFRNGVDPYGSPWKPTVRGGQTLRRTGRLLNSYFTRSTAKDFAVFTSLFYALVQQSGKVIRAKAKPFLRFRIGNRWVSTKKVTIPSRLQIPTQSGGIPDRWMARFDVIFRIVFKQWAGSFAESQL